jgi:hypothetical protein
MVGPFRSVLQPQFAPNENKLRAPRFKPEIVTIGFNDGAIFELDFLTMIFTPKLLVNWLLVFTGENSDVRAMERGADFAPDMTFYNPFVIVND